VSLFLSDKVFDSRARYVAGVGRVTESNDRFILLFCGVQELRDPCRPSDEQHEDTSRKRVERSSVSDFFLADNFPYTRNHVMRSHARGFVDDQDAVHGCHCSPVGTKYLWTAVPLLFGKRRRREISVAPTALYWRMRT
jgi:hypothetical protein